MDAELNIEALEILLDGDTQLTPSILKWDAFEKEHASYLLCTLTFIS